jgi:hypothetical protein
VTHGDQIGLPAKSPHGVTDGIQQRQTVSASNDYIASQERDDPDVAASRLFVFVKGRVLIAE